MVANMRLSGNFMLDGQENKKLEKGEHVIAGAATLGPADLLAITATIKFNDVGVTLPVPVEVKWAGDTPVIVLENVRSACQAWRLSQPGSYWTRTDTSELVPTTGRAGTCSAQSRLPVKSLPQAASPCPRNNCRRRVGDS
jgi:hypothetical protein